MITSIRRLGTIAATGILSAVAMSAAPSPAHAWDHTNSDACSSGGHVANMTIKYDLLPNYHVWGIMYGVVSGDGTGGQSNFQGSVWGTTTNRVWLQSSADTYANGEQWSRNVLNAAGDHVRTLRSNTELVKMKASFDTAGTDPTCTAQLTY